MMEMEFALTEDSLVQIARLMGARVRFDAEVALADAAIAQMIVDEIPNHMHWKHSSGELAGSFASVRRGSYYAAESDLPWARRREFGFSGRTDSRGRYYANDPGAFYVKAALAVIGPLVEPRYVQAASTALGPEG